MSNNTVIDADAVAAVVGFCNDYSPAVFAVAKWFLYLALLVALVGAIAWAISKFLEARRRPGGSVTESFATDAGSKFLDSLKALVDSLASAPPWFAIFLAGLLLLWMAGERPDVCAPPDAEDGTEESRTADAEEEDAGNAGDNAAEPEEKAAAGTAGG